MDFFKNNYLNEFLYLLNERRSRIILLILLFLSNSLLDVIGIGLIGPYISIVLDIEKNNNLFYKIINFINLPEDREKLLIIVGSFLVFIFLFKAVFTILIYYQIIKFCKNQERFLREKLLKNYFETSYDKFISIKKSDFVDRLARLCETFAIGILYPLFRVISEGIVALAILSLLAYQNPIALGILLTLICVAIALYDTLLRKNMNVHGKIANDSFAGMVKIFQEIHTGFKEIRILGKENFFQERSKVNSNNFVYSTGLHMLVHIIPKSFLELLLIIFIVSLVLISILFNQKSELLIQTIGVFGVASIRLLPSANLFSSSLVTIRYSRDTVSKLYKDLYESEQNKEILNKKHTQIVKNKFSSITLKNVNFSYSNAKKKILKNINLTISKGDFIGLVGESGSGKTTLVDIILGLLKPTEGNIILNDQNLISVLNDWHYQLAYIPQDLFMIDSNIAENISLSDKFDKKKLEKAIIKSQLAEFLDNDKNDKADSENYLNKRVLNLSGGQRQRVALARAFYHDRQVLILDESTSALDNKVENEIVKELLDLKGKITVIVISHRLTALKNCERILEVSSGELKEVGNYKNLLKQK